MLAVGLEQGTAVHYFLIIYTRKKRVCGRDSSVGIVTRYGLTVRESNPVGDEISRTRPDWPWAPPRLLYNGYRVFHGNKAAGVWC